MHEYFGFHLLSHKYDFVRIGILKYLKFFHHFVMDEGHDVIPQSWVEEVKEGHLILLDLLSNGELVHVG